MTLAPQQQQQSQPPVDDEHLLESASEFSEDEKDPAASSDDMASGDESKGKSPKDTLSVEEASNGLFTENVVPQEESKSEDAQLAAIREAVSSALSRIPGTVNKHATATSPDLILVANSGAYGTLNLTSDLDEVEVFIEHEEMNEIERVCRGDETVRAAMNLLSDNVVGGGMSVSMDINGTSVKLNEVMQRMFDVEWTQRFIKDLLWNLCMFGFAVVRLVNSNVIRTQAVPMVIDKADYEITMVRSFNKAREYRIYPLRFNANGKRSRLSDQFVDHIDGANQGVNKPKQVRERKAQKIYDGDASVAVYVLPGSEPLADGTINSPLKTVVDNLKKMDWMWNDLSCASHWASRPPWGINTTQGRAAPMEQDSLKNYNPPQAVVALHQQGEQIKHREREIAELGDSMKSAIDTVRMNAASDEGTDRVGRWGQNPHAHAAPMRNFFMPGLTHAIATGPQPTFIPAFIELTKVSASKVAMALQVPAEMLIPGQQVHAANAELAMRRWDIVISAYQKIVEPIVADLFSMAYGGAIKDLQQRWPVETVEKWAEKGTSDDNEPARARIGGEEHLLDVARRHIKSTGAPANVPVDADRHTSEKLKHQFLSKQKKAQAKIGLKDISHKNAATLMAQHSPIIHVRFDQTPMRMFADILNLYMLNLIPYEELAKHAVSIYRLDPSKVLTKEEHDAQEKEKRKTESQLTETYGPPEGVKPAAAGPGGAKKKDSKAVGQQGASTKKRKSEGSKSGGTSKGSSGALSATK